MNNIQDHFKLSNPWHLLATGFGSGLSPIVPGTMGSLTAIPFWLLMYWLLPIWLCWLVILLSFGVGIFICQCISDDIQVCDHGSIVLDEFVGMWLTLMTIFLINWQWVLIACVMFRLFDMFKPWPLSWLDKHIGGGLGIMLDDIIAAIFAIVIVITISHYSSVL